MVGGSKTPKPTTKKNCSGNKVSFGEISTDEKTDLMVHRGHKKHIHVFFWEHIPQKSPLADVLRSTCPPPCRCLLPLATAAPETLPPLTTTPAAACHLAQHNDKGGGGAAAACQQQQGRIGKTTTAATNNNKGERGCRLPLPSLLLPSVAISKRCLCCNGTC